MKYRRTLIIGDVHGCLDELNELLTKVDYKPLVDRLVFCGDLVDRGPKSVEVVRKIRELKVECVMGNHDAVHVRYRRHILKNRLDPKYKIPMRHIGEHKIKINEQLSDEDFQFLENLPTFIKLDEKWVVVHAGLEPTKPLEQQDPDKVTNIRYLNPETLKTVSIDKHYRPPPGSIYWTEAYYGPYSVIYGHNVHWFDSPEVKEVTPGVFTVGIDTGACFGGQLTCMIFEEGKEGFSFEKVQAKEAYWERSGL